MPQETFSLDPVLPIRRRARGAAGAGLLLTLCAALPAAAQERMSPPAPPPSGNGETPPAGDEIRVEGERPRGSVVGDVEPELELGFPDIRAYGVATVAELVAELSAQTSAAGGPPVVLLNGRRVASFAAIRDIPAEAIERAEILPEEAALAYGYPAGQKVINVVLRPRYRTVSGELRGSAAAGGSGESGQGALGAFRVRDDTRLSLNGSYRTAHGQAAGEGDRQPAARTSRVSGQDWAGDHADDTGPSSETLEIGGSLAVPVAADLGGTLSTRYERVQSRGYGRTTDDEVAGPTGPALAATAAAANSGVQTTVAETAHVGLALDGAPRSWQWSFDGAYDLATTQRSDTADTADDEGDAAIGTMQSRSSLASLTADLLVSGQPFTLPAGKATASLRGGVSSSEMESAFRFAGAPASASRSRQLTGGQVSIDLPLADADRGVLAVLGELSASATLGFDQASDAGSLPATSYALRWSPVEELRLTVSRSDRTLAPTLQQLGDPAVTVPNVPVFDYARGETALVALGAGGNALLTNSERHALRIGAVVKPLASADLTLLVNFDDVRTENPVYAFDVPTPAIEAAFPERFVRDAQGRLVGVDGRPINAAEARSTQLRWGVDLSIPLKTARQRQAEAWLAGGAREEDRPSGMQGILVRRGPGDDGEPAGGRPPPPAGAGDPHGDQGPLVMFRSGPGSPRGSGPPGQGRLQLALFHTWHLEEQLALGASLPTLDLLGGDAVSSDGGQPRHELEARLGWFNDGLGVRLSANWQSATRVEDALGENTDLHFGDRATVTLRAFANLGQVPGLADEIPFLRGTRVSLGIENLFDSRQVVRVGAEGPALDYRPSYLDTSGRALSVGLRKIF